MKRLICLLLTIIAMLSLLGCNSETESKLAELETRLQSQEEVLQSQNENISNLEQKNNELQSRLDASNAEKEELNKQIALQKAQLENLTGNPIKYTEEEPAIKPPANCELYADFDNATSDVTFNSFFDYCKETFSAKNSFYLLEPIHEDWGVNPMIRREYSVYVEREEEGQPINPIFMEHVEFYSDVLGDGEFNYQYGEGWHAWSMEIIGYFVPVDFSKTNMIADFRFNFGDNSDAIDFGYPEWNKEWNKYVNIYKGGTCIGTCYFKTNTSYVSERWFGQYLVDYLALVSEA